MSFEYDHCFGLFLKQNIPVMITEENSCLALVKNGVESVKHHFISNLKIHNFSF